MSGLNALSLNSHEIPVPHLNKTMLYKPVREGKNRTILPPFPHPWHFPMAGGHPTTTCSCPQGMRPHRSGHPTFWMMRRPLYHPSISPPMPSTRTLTDRTEAIALLVPTSFLEVKLQPCSWWGNQHMVVSHINVMLGSYIFNVTV